VIRSKSVFVIGAGASNEVGLPLGSDLKKQIAKKVNIKFDIVNQQISGDANIVDILRVYEKKKGETQVNIYQYLQAGRDISDAMPQAISIDNFIDTHTDNDQIKIIGKIAIVKCIREAEKRSELFVDPSIGKESIDFGNISNKWYGRFFHFLAEDTRTTDRDNIMDDVSFIVFNYDRCIEHYLYLALQNYYRIGAAEARDIMARLNIIHPYGVVGELEWQGSGAGIPFGYNEKNPQINLGLSHMIKTFSERVDDNTVIKQIRDVMREANIIVFLGLYYHKMNMEIIKPGTFSQNRKIIGTAFGIFDSDLRIINNKIHVDLISNYGGGGIDLRNNMKCAELFRECSRIIGNI